MARFYSKKEEAETARRWIADDNRIESSAVQFEPGNGWVVLVVPKRIQCDDLAEDYDVRDGVPRSLNRPKPPPTEEERVEQKQPKTPVEPGGPPRKGKTKMAWDIANRLKDQGRDAIIAACLEAGLNKSTASVQYSKWKKAQGQ